jgi:hypothetical protein
MPDFFSVTTSKWAKVNVSFAMTLGALFFVRRWRAVASAAMLRASSCYVHDQPFPIAKVANFIVFYRDFPISIAVTATFHISNSILRVLLLFPLARFTAHFFSRRFLKKWNFFFAV